MEMYFKDFNKRAMHQYSFFLFYGLLHTGLLQLFLRKEGSKSSYSGYANVYWPLLCYEVIVSSQGLLKSGHSIEGL